MKKEYTKLKWYRFKIARRILNLEGEALIAELEDIIQDIRNKKLDKLGVFQLQIVELENMIAEIKAKPKAKGRQYDPFHIPASGDGRLALFGVSNVGKSTLMNAITNTDVKTGAYLHTTRIAHAGTCEYEDLKIQIIDLPGFLDFKEEWAISKQIVRVARTSDAILMVIDLSMDVELQYNFLMKQLEDARLIVDGETPYKFSIIATKGDLPDTKESFQKLKKITDLEIHPITIKEEETLEQLKKTLFEQLDIIRVYTKKPGQKVDREKPFVLPIGTTVADIAEKIHTSFIQRFRFARVWGPSAEFEGQNVGLDHELKDTDIIEMIVERR
ncbi:MAG: 50S ribosome-binding GTPase [Candidatus Heimdallarchaeota archaeon]|nr:50S ribosome-binding GTPase [Candidatus Heimdallarchaeota archaeon]MCK4955831.1 50S ribosome-binding GTPase [Candidatus Heimdallarchaeota archaeon]